MPGGRKCISIVTPCFNEEANVAECHAAVRRLFEQSLATYDYEHLFCDNASTDGTVAVLREIAAPTSTSRSSSTRATSAPSAPPSTVF